MLNSTITLQQIVDSCASQADTAPSANPGSYAADTVMAVANDVMNDLIARRFNWKWNSKRGTPFLTNSFQQDYPQVGVTDIGWLEDAFCIDVNTLQRPVEPFPVKPQRDLAVEGPWRACRPEQVAWMYNAQLDGLGSWPGASVVYSPLRTQAPIEQNPIASMVDTNGNLLVLTTYGTTGGTAPFAPPLSVEGVTVDDGSCVWTVAAFNSQGWRVAPLPPGTGPVYEVHTKYQMRAVPFTTYQQTLGVIPDDYSSYFREGFDVTSYKYAADLTVRRQYPGLRRQWLEAISAAESEGEREPDSFRLLPATSVVDRQYGLRNPQDPSRPY